MEHRDFLGNSLAEIAYDKAGIIKKNIQAFSLDQEKLVHEIFEKEGNVSFFGDFIKVTNLKILKSSLLFSLVNPTP